MVIRRFYHLTILFHLFSEFYSTPNPCPNKWTHDPNNPTICYLDVSSTINDLPLSKADDYCKKLTPSSTLPTFLTTAEYISFECLAQKFKYPDGYWIGLQLPSSIGFGFLYTWLYDGTSSQPFLFWSMAEPTSGNPCVVTQNANYKGTVGCPTGPGCPGSSVPAPSAATTGPCGSSNMNNDKYSLWKSTRCADPHHVVCQLRMTSCPSGYYVDRSGVVCYHYIKQDTAQNARKLCSKSVANATLPVFNTKMEMNNYIDLVTSKNFNPNTWLGMVRPCSYPNAKSSFWWLDGSPATMFDNWNTNEPNNAFAAGSNVQENCAFMGGNYKWFDVSCQTTKAVVCQYRMVKPITPVISTMPICPVISEEYCPYGWVQNATVPYLCYFFVSYQTPTIAEAKTICASINNAASLPKLLSTDESDALSGMMKKCHISPTSLWIGLNHTSGVVYVEGESELVVMPNWQTGAPILGGGHKVYVTNSKTMKWSNEQGESNQIRRRVVCELRLGSPNPNVVDTCSFIPPSTGYTQACLNTMVTPDNRAWIFLNRTVQPSAASTVCQNKFNGYLVRPQFQADIDNLDKLTGGTQFWIGAKHANLSTYNRPQWLPRSSNDFVNWWPSGSPNTTDYSTSAGPYYYYSNLTAYQNAYRRSHEKAHSEPPVYMVCERAISNRSACTRVQSLGNCPQYAVVNGQVKICDGLASYVTCDANYNLLGSNPLYCFTNSSGGYWSDDPPQCLSACATNPCLNGGSCLLTSSGTTCNCVGSYTGSICQVPPVPTTIEPDETTTTATQSTTPSSSPPPPPLMSAQPLPPATTVDYVANPPDPLTKEQRTAATVTQSLGCTILLILVGATFIIFAVFRIMSLDRMMQMIQEIALVIAHTIIMILMKKAPTKALCIVAAMVLQYTFLVNFAFLTLETLQTYCILQNVISIGGFLTWKINLAIGLGAPTIITAVTAMIAANSYPSTYSCWVNLGSPIAMASVMPILFCTITSTVLTEAAAMNDMNRLPLTPLSKHTAAMVSQKGAVFIIAFNILSWGLGMWSLYHQNLAAYGTETLFNILLGVVIATFHIMGNDIVHDYFISKFCKKKNKRGGN